MSTTRRSTVGQQARLEVLDKEESEIHHEITQNCLKHTHVLSGSRAVCANTRLLHPVSDMRIKLAHAQPAHTQHRVN